MVSTDFVVMLNPYLKNIACTRVRIHRGWHWLLDKLAKIARPKDHLVERLAAWNHGVNVLSLVHLDLKEDGAWQVHTV